MKEFGSLAAFAIHLQEVAIAEAVAQRAALSKAAKMVEKRAKKKIGQYQDQVGPFIAWPELAEATKADRLRQGFTEDNPLLRTGDMRDSISHVISLDGMEAAIGSDSDIAVYQELGTEHIPPRSFLGGAAAELAPKIAELAGKAATMALMGEKVFEGKLMIEGLDV